MKASAQSEKEHLLQARSELHLPTEIFTSACDFSCFKNKTFPSLTQPHVALNLNDLKE